jgi:pimeloyl-ACP methyl ester carboxylesterase
MRRSVRALALALAALLVLLTFGPFLVPVHPYQGKTPDELADQGSRFITVRGIRLYYKVYGQGEPFILLLHGDDDRIIPQSNSRRLVSLNNHFTFVPLAGLGHVPQEEGPQAFLDVMLPWLRNTLGLPVSSH